MADGVRPGDPQATATVPRAESRPPSFAHHHHGLVGLAHIVALAAFSFIGPLVYHSDQVHANIQLTNLPPGRGRPLGTDSNGYDILGRLMIGGQATLEICFCVAALATAFGVVWGAVSGYSGGLADAIMMRAQHIALAIPAIFWLIYLASGFRPSIALLIGGRE